jgi:outer membrane lipoprotein carrier protein
MQISTKGIKAGLMKKLYILTMLLIFGSSVFCNAQEGTPPKTVIENDLKVNTETLLDQIEHRYKGEGFTATFRQETPLKAIGISESASGKTLFKKGGKLRWEYETPEKIHYISDGTTLWIHSLEDNQVWQGSAENFFGKSGGAGFLTDIKMLRHEFSVTSAVKNQDDYVVSMIPSGESYGIKTVSITVSASTFDMTRITTINTNEGETSIFLSDFNYEQTPDDRLFHFTAPEGANVIPLE